MCRLWPLRTYDIVSISGGGAWPSEVSSGVRGWMLELEDDEEEVEELVDKEEEDGEK